LVFGSTDELDILEALVETNHQRVKTNEQIGREAAVLLRVEKERAKRRQAENAKATAAQKTSSNKERVPTSKEGQSRDAVGKKTGRSGKTAERAAFAVKIIDALNAVNLADRFPGLAPEDVRTDFMILCAALWLSRSYCGANFEEATKALRNPPGMSLPPLRALSMTRSLLPWYQPVVKIRGTLTGK